MCFSAKRISLIFEELLGVSVKKLIFSLTEAIERFSCSEDKLLNLASNGDLCLYVEVPTELNVYATPRVNETLNLGKLSSIFVEPLSGSSLEKFTNISYLSLSLQDAQQIVATGRSTAIKFSHGLALDGMELEVVKPSLFLNDLKIYKKDHVHLYQHVSSYGDAVPLQIKSSDIFVRKEDVERCIHGDSSDYARYGDYIPTEYTSDKLKALNMASTLAHLEYQMNKMYSASSISIMLTKNNIFGSDLARRSAQFVVPDYINDKNLKRSGCECLKETPDTKDFYSNKYTSKALAIINEGSELLNSTNAGKEQMKKWFEERGFKGENINSVVNIIRIN